MAKSTLVLKIDLRQWVRQILNELVTRSQQRRAARRRQPWRRS